MSGIQPRFGNNENQETSTGIQGQIDRLTAAKTAVADAIIAKGVTVPADAKLEDMAPLITAIEAGGSGEATPAILDETLWQDVLFIDYDGTVLYTYTIEEVQALTELPPLPSRDGLVCQGWNYDLETLKGQNRAITVGAMYTTNDGKTRIYIQLEEGRTSPMLGCCPDGTVTIDWGDGSAPDTLLGSSLTTLEYTGAHEYPSGGEYVITLTVDGTVSFAGVSKDIEGGSALLCFTNAQDIANHGYQAAIRKIEIGDNVPYFYRWAFARCFCLSAISIPKTTQLSTTNAHKEAFAYCTNLRAVVIPNGTTMIPQGTFSNCHGLKHISIPNSLRIVQNYVFEYCHSLTRLPLPNSLESIMNYSIRQCLSLRKVVIPSKIIRIYGSTFDYDYALSRVEVEGTLVEIQNFSFRNCESLAVLDLRHCTSIPTATTSALTGLRPANGLKIYVPAALAEDWKAATNWTVLADCIIGV